MAILRLLAEIYKKQNLRLNLKFEIEVLCKALKLELSGIIYILFFLLSFFLKKLNLPIF